MKKIDELEKTELKEIHEMVNKELGILLRNIEAKSGYYVSGEFSLFADEPKKCIDVDLELCMLEAPHLPEEFKVKYYIKVNPDNVLNKPIFAHKHNSWYMIYNGVHRVEANKRLGEKTIKAHIIVPSGDE